MRPITDVLRDIRKGRVVDAASDELAEVVRAVLATDKAGELTLKLKIKPQGKGDNAVIVSAQVTSRRPQVCRPSRQATSTTSATTTRALTKRCCVFSRATR